MNDKPSSHPATPTRAAIWRLTLVLPLLLFSLGFLGSRFVMGCGASEALPKATAYTLSGLAGWMVYLLIMRPSHLTRPSHLLFAPYLALSLTNVPMPNPTKTPWPFPQMLIHGVIVSVLCMSLMGLVSRRLMGGKRARPSGAHPLADVVVDQRLSGR